MKDREKATGAHHMTRRAGSVAGIKSSQCEPVFLFYFWIFFLMPERSKKKKIGRKVTMRL